MKKSQLRKIIKEVIKEQIGTATLNTVAPVLNKVGGIEEKVFIKKVEKIVERVLDSMVEESAVITTDDDDEAIIPMNVLDEIEDYMGEPITFMGIS